MNKFLKFLLVFIPIALASVAGWFSISGAMTMFSGAAWGVAVMFGILECSKLVIASTLQRTWKVLSAGLKTYLVAALVVIMLITSIGIYGFLSGAYQKTKSNYDLELSKNDTITIRYNKMNGVAESYQNRISAKEEELTKLSELRTSQETRATQNTTGLTAGVDNLQTKTNKQIEKLQTQIDSFSNIVLAYQDSAMMLENIVEQNKLKASINSELGPLVFIASITGWKMDMIVNIFILLIIFTFDPLSIILALTQPYITVAEEAIKHEEKEIIKTETKPIELSEELLGELLDEPEPMVEPSIEPAIEKEISIFDAINQSMKTDNFSGMNLQQQNKQELNPVVTPAKKKGRPTRKDSLARISEVASALPTITEAKEKRKYTKKPKNVDVEIVNEPTVSEFSVSEPTVNELEINNTATAEVVEKVLSKKEIERNAKAQKLYSGEIKNPEQLIENYFEKP